MNLPAIPRQPHPDVTQAAARLSWACPDAPVADRYDADAHPAHDWTRDSGAVVRCRGYRLPDHHLVSYDVADDVHEARNGDLAAAREHDLQLQRGDGITRR